MAKKETINHLLTQDSFRKLLDELSSKDIKDFAITYRLENGEFYQEWLGDYLALATMVDLLESEILKMVEISDFTKDNE